MVEIARKTLDHAIAIGDLEGGLMKLDTPDGGGNKGIFEKSGGLWPGGIAGPAGAILKQLSMRYQEQGQRRAKDNQPPQK
jgi:hypothetical protein